MNQNNSGLPPIGAWVRTAGGVEGQVVAHLLRPGKPPLARVRFSGDRHGWFEAGRIRDVGGE